MTECSERLKYFHYFETDYDGKPVDKNHMWIKKMISFDNKLEVSSGKINLCCPDREVEVCYYCGEIRNAKYR